MKKVNFKEFHRLLQAFRHTLENYSLSKGDTSDSYHIAKTFLNQISERSYRDLDYLKLSTEWLNTRSTLKLKKLLESTNYNDSLPHFNAMSLLDTVAAKFIKK